MVPLSYSYKDYAGCYQDIVSRKTKTTTIRPMMRPFKEEGLEQAQKRINRLVSTIDNPRKKVQHYYRLRYPKAKGGSRLICERPEITGLFFIKFFPWVEGVAPIMYSSAIDGEEWYQMGDDEALHRLAVNDGFANICDLLTWFHGTYGEELLSIIFGVVGI